MSRRLVITEARRIGGHAWRYLRAQPREGHVVSRFSGGINLLFEDGETFVPVQTLDVPLHPWAVQVPGQPLSGEEGASVTVENRGIHIGDSVVLLGNAKVEALCLPRFSKEEVETALRRLPLLAQFIEEARRTRPPDPFQPQIEAILHRWQKTGDPNILLDLIGLGSGSTPSGDDALVGILAGISLFENVEPLTSDRLDQLRISIRRSVGGRTPFPSAQMLLAACERTFDEPILKLVAGLTSPNIQENNLLEKADRVFQLGHHSGLAMLLGLRTELVSWCSPNAQRFPEDAELESGRWIVQ